MAETIIKRAPNQDQDEIHREKVAPPFLYIKLESIDVAKANLSPVAFCLWLYLARHKDGTKWLFSMEHFCKWCGCSLPTGRKAKKELLDPELSYLVSVKGTTRNFDFYEYPEILKQRMKEDKQEVEVTIHRECESLPGEDSFKF